MVAAEERVEGKNLYQKGASLWGEGGGMHFCIT